MKLKAFTILEIIIALALTSIIVSMVYAFFLFMSKSTNNYITHSTENMLVQLFYTNLKREAYISEEIVSTNSENFDMNFYNGEKVQYSMKGDYLFRSKNNQRDSIRVKNVSIEAVDLPSLKNNNHLVESIHISAHLFDNEIPMRVYKNYFSKYPNFK